MRLTDDQAMTEALRRFELAIGEVHVIERRENKVVTGRIVRNKDALARAKKAYTDVARFLGAMRAKQPTYPTTDRQAIRNALTRLDALREQLADLESIQ